MIMPKVTTSVWINAPLATVYEIAKDNTKFPEFMEDVKSVEIVSQEGPSVVSKWVGVISAFNVKVRWTQRDEWDDSAHTCSYSQVSGDYDSMAGTWSFFEENGGTRFDSELDYEYSVPGLGALVGKVIYLLVVKNMDDVLGAIKARAESA